MLSKYFLKLYNNARKIVTHRRTHALRHSLAPTNEGKKKKTNRGEFEKNVKFSCQMTMKIIGGKPKIKPPALNIKFKIWRHVTNEYFE